MNIEKLPRDLVGFDVKHLRIRKIRNKNKYKIYNLETKEIYNIYESRKLAHNALMRLKEKKKVKFDDIVIIHIRDGKSIKKQIKEQIK